ncbi:MAG: TRAP transporter small permease [Candidatus Accumulibacter sp.]|nr:TRAP transporter small permease [Accumulibacter sp.]
MAQKFIHVLYDKVVFNLVWVVGLTMSVCILLQIFGRSFFKLPFSWTDELARFTFLWFCLFGSVLTLRSKLHLGIDYFESKMPERVKFRNRIFVYALVIVFGFLLCVLGTQLLGIVGRQLTPVMRIPMACVYFALPVTGFLYVIIGGWQMYCHVKDLPYETEAPPEVPDEVRKMGEEALRGKGGKS